MDVNFDFKKVCSIEDGLISSEKPTGTLRNFEFRPFFFF